MVKESIEINIKTTDPKIRIGNFKEALKKALELTLEHTPARTPEEINNGYCGVFADYVCYIFSGDKIEICGTCHRFYKSNVYHTYIKYKGKCYDSECFDGVESELDLPLYASIRKPILFSFLKFIKRMFLEPISSSKDQKVHSK